MAIHVCVCADTLAGPEDGGRLWTYLHWALGLALGCRVSWLEELEPESALVARERVAALRGSLARFGLAEGFALCRSSPEAPAQAKALGCLTLEDAAEAELVLNFRPDLSAEVVGCFRRSALIDLDPGPFQLRLAAGEVVVSRHDVYFTVGETAGRPGGTIPDAGLCWIYTPPCVALNHWPVSPPPDDAAFTALSAWTEDERAGFLPFVDLPRRTRQRLELALPQKVAAHADLEILHRRGWSVRDAATVISAPSAYERFVRGSRGEFRWARPEWVRLETARLGEHTLNYLASGRPAVVQHTGPSRLLPDAAGLFRFRDPDEAARCLEAAAADPERHGRLARSFVEDRFDARKVLKRVLEVALP